MIANGGILGPPGAEDTLREAIAWCARRSPRQRPRFCRFRHARDPHTRALEREGPFDPALVGRNSTDSDTGQVGPQVAEFLGLPFLGGVRQMEPRIGGDQGAM